MMPAVNYEPAGVMARIKKLDIGSLLTKKKIITCSHGGLLKQHQHCWSMTLQFRSTGDMWTDRSQHTPSLLGSTGIFQSPTC